MRSVLPERSRGGRGRCSVRVRQSPAPRRTARHRATVQVRGEAELDGAPGAAGRGERRRDGRRVVQDEQIARREEAGEVAHARVAPGARRADRRRGGDRRAAPRAARSRRAWVTVPPTPRPRGGRRSGRSPRPARSGRCARRRRREASSVERSASGIGVGVHRRVHLAGIDGDDAHAGPLELRAQDPAEVIEPRLRDAVRAPARIGRDGRVGGDVHDEAASPERHRRRDELREAERDRRG